MKMLEPLTMEERDGDMPQDRPNPPARRELSPPSSRNRSQPVSHPGAYLSFLSHSPIFFALLRLFTVSSVTQGDLKRF
jgi:hypothetical protein